MKNSLSKNQNKIGFKFFILWIFSLYAAPLYPLDSNINTGCDRSSLRQQYENNKINQEVINKSISVGNNRLLPNNSNDFNQTFNLSALLVEGAINSVTKGNREKKNSFVSMQQINVGQSPTNSNSNNYWSFSGMNAEILREKDTFQLSLEGDALSSSPSTVQNTPITTPKTSRSGTPAVSAYKNISLTKEEEAIINENPLQCKVCDKVFRNKGILKTHLRTHSDDINVRRPYICWYESCGQRFTKKGSLVDHIAIHEGKKEHECGKCGKRFRKRTTLKHHENTHIGKGEDSDEKPFKCDVCQKGFSVKHNMIIHKRIHTGEKPHVCSLCSKKYTSKTSLNNHVKSNHKELWAIQHKNWMDKQPKMIGTKKSKKHSKSKKKKKSKKKEKHSKSKKKKKSKK